MEWTILDPYGTPYGGERNNIGLPIRRGGSGYEAEELYDWYTYGDELDMIDEIGRRNFGGPA